MPEQQQEKQPLTERQAFVFAAIEKLIRDRGYGPTFREVGIATGIKSTNGVSYSVSVLVKKGWLLCEPKTARTIRLTP